MSPTEWHTQEAALVEFWLQASSRQVEVARGILHRPTAEPGQLACWETRAPSGGLWPGERLRAVRALQPLQELVISNPCRRAPGQLLPSCKGQ